MAGESNQAKWFGVRPTDPEEPFTIIQGTAANLKAQIEIAADQSVAVTSAAYPNLKATVVGTDAAPIKVKQNVAANLKSEVVPSASAIFSNTPARPTGSTQIIAYNTVTNGAVDAHVVTAGKTLHLVTWVLNGICTNVAGANCSLYILNAGDGLEQILNKSWLLENTSVDISLCFSVPIEIPAGWKVQLQATVTNSTTSAQISGYEI